jgi:hypothetical protein
MNPSQFQHLMFKFHNFFHFATSSLDVGLFKGILASISSFWTTIPTLPRPSKHNEPSLQSSLSTLGFITLEHPAP